jgi:hypothetical protein
MNMGLGGGEGGANRFHGKNMHKFCQKISWKKCTNFCQKISWERCAQILPKDFMVKNVHKILPKDFMGEMFTNFLKKYYQKNVQKLFSKNTLDAKQRCDAPNSLKPFLLSYYNYNISCCCDDKTLERKKN